jgi:hypothetical protein
MKLERQGKANTSTSLSWGPVPFIPFPWKVISIGSTETRCTACPCWNINKICKQKPWHLIGQTTITWPPLKIGTRKRITLTRNNKGKFLSKY